MADSFEHADPTGAIPAGSAARTAPACTGAVIGAGWRAYRRWRRSRPFWAGILLMIAGAELLLIPLPMHSMGLILHIGVGGVSGILIGAVLIVAGLLLWFNPAQRMFYSIVAVLLAIAALVASNLGGFLLGTALGVIGGSLGFAWTPLAPGTAPRSLWRRRPRVPADGVGGVTDVAGDARPADETSAAEPQGVTAPEALTQPDTLSGPAAAGHEHGTTLRGFTLLPVLAIIAALLHLGSTGSTPSADPSATATPAATCTSAPTTSTPAPSPAGSTCAGASAASPDPTSGADSAPDPSPAVSASPSASASPGASASPSASPSPVPTGTAPPFAIATSQSTLTASSATISGFAYDGVVTVPTAGGSVQMMQFSATSLDLSDMQLTVSQGGATMTTTAGALDLTGDVVLYATELSGDLLGIPLTITPSTPIADILQVLGEAGLTQSLTQVVPLELTNVTTLQPFTSATGMSTSDLQIS
jgi:Family of unknown function (DUF6114)